MDQLNKIVSLAIGLIIVVISFAALTGRIDLSKNFPQLLSSKKITSTPTPAVVAQKTVLIANDANLESSAAVNKYDQNLGSANPTQIPETGSPTEALGIAISLIAVGQYLKRIK